MSSVTGTSVGRNGQTDHEHRPTLRAVPSRELASVRLVDPSGGWQTQARPIRILGRRESGIVEGQGWLVELDQLFIQMQIVDHQTHLDVEPLSKHLARTVLRPTSWATAGL